MLAAGEHLGRRQLIVELARDLRDAIAGTAASGRLGAAYRSLAVEIARLPAGLDRDLADLRLFARINVGECADLLCVEPRLVAACWRRVKASMFQCATRQRRRGC